MLIPFSITTDREWEYRQSWPIAVFVITLACVAIHLYLKVELTTPQWINVVYEFGAVKYDFRWFTIFTCTFLHGNWMHLIGNMLFLLVYGATLERFLGSPRFVILYLAGAVFSIAVHLLTLSPLFIDVPTIGASGAISAVLGAFFVLLPKAQLKCLFIFFLRPLIVTLPAYAVLGLWFMVQLYFSIEPVSMSEEVAFWAHVAGFASGALVGSIMHGQLAQSIRAQTKAAESKLEGAWRAVLQNNTTAAHAFFQQYQEVDLPNRPAQPLLTAVLSERSGDRQTAGNEYMKAFQRASNAMHFGHIVTAYLQLRLVLSPQNIPAVVHRDGGLAAASCKLPTLALDAFRLAMQNGLEEGVELVLQRTEALLEHKLKHEEAAAQISRLRAAWKDEDVGRKA